MVKLHCQSWIIYVFFVVVVVVDLFCYLTQAAKKRKELFVLGSLWEKIIRPVHWFVSESDENVEEVICYITFPLLLNFY